MKGGSAYVSHAKGFLAAATFLYRHTLVSVQVSQEVIRMAIWWHI